MTEEQLREKLRVLDLKHEEDRDDILDEYIEENAKYSIGDEIFDSVSSMIIEGRSVKHIKIKPVIAYHGYSRDGNYQMVLESYVRGVNKKSEEDGTNSN